MPSSCTFAGVPFLLPSPEAEEALELRLPLAEARITLAERAWSGWSTAGLTYPHRFPARPSLALNQFFYPTQISRWGEFNGLIDQDGYDAITGSQFTSTGNPAGTFSIVQDDQTISTSMFCLPPRPLFKADAATGLYLVTLVDQRFYLQWQNAGVLNGGAWDGLLSDIASLIGITLGQVSSNPAYGTAHPHSAFRSRYDNAALMMDAVCFNTGRVIVRKFDGSYYAQDVTLAKSTYPSSSPSLLAGGDFNQGFATDGSKNYALNSILPNKVVVSFPRYATGCSPQPGYSGVDRSHIPFPQTEGNRYTIEKNIADYQPDYVGFTGTMTFHTTAEAYSANGSGTPVNLTQLTDLAGRIAQDYYAWQVQSLDETTCGIYPWVPDGINDLLVTVTRDKAYTRIQRKPYNFMVEEFCHHFPPPGSSSSSSSCGNYVNCIRVCNDGVTAYLYPGTPGEQFYLSTVGC